MAEKLVRDKIPEIIEADGGGATFRPANGWEFLDLIGSKAVEEAEEFRDAASPKAQVEELADLLEVIHVAAKAIGVSYRDVESARVAKREERGGFDKGIVLTGINNDN